MKFTEKDFFLFILIIVVEIAAALSVAVLLHFSKTIDFVYVLFFTAPICSMIIFLMIFIAVEYALYYEVFRVEKEQKEQE